MQELKAKHTPRYRLRAEDAKADARRAIYAALDAWRKAYCPYSHFRVGAAIVTSDGSLFSGCNVESADYDGTHAEESALAAMVLSGRRDPVILAVVGALDSDDPGFVVAPPCGKCRQKLMEFAQYSGRELMILTNLEEDYEYVLLSDVLPDAFGPRDIGVDCGGK